MTKPLIVSPGYEVDKSGVSALGVIAERWRTLRPKSHGAAPELGFTGLLEMCGYGQPAYLLDQGVSIVLEREGSTYTQVTVQPTYHTFGTHSRRYSDATGHTVHFDKGVSGTPLESIPAGSVKSCLLYFLSCAANSDLNPSLAPNIAHYMSDNPRAVALLEKRHVTFLGSLSQRLGRLLQLSSPQTKP